jgi:hypothetical protein
MTDRPILFSGPMVQALLDGRKTQTRRALKGAWQTALEGHDEVLTWFAPRHVPKEGIINQWAESGIWARQHGPRGYNRFLGFSPYRPGDRLWVREAWRITRELDHVAPRDLDHTIIPEWLASDPELYEGRKRPGIHLPRWASRLTLLVTDVGVQRLQDISQDDAIAEGPGFIGKITGEVCESATSHRLGIGPRWRTPRDWYADLWDNLNAHRGFGWEANPWVVAISFTVHRVNIDKLEASK